MQKSTLLQDGDYGGMSLLQAGKLQVYRILIWWLVHSNIQGHAQHTRAPLGIEVTLWGRVFHDSVGCWVQRAGFSVTYDSSWDYSSSGAQGWSIQNGSLIWVALMLWVHLEQYQSILILFSTASPCSLGFTQHGNWFPRVRVSRASIPRGRKWKLLKVWA